MSKERRKEGRARRTLSRRGSQAVRFDGGADHGTRGEHVLPEKVKWAWAWDRVSGKKGRGE